MLLRFASSITVQRDIEQAMQDLLAPVDQCLTRGEVDLVLLFTTAHFEDELPQIVDRLSSAMPGCSSVGCTAEGTIGSGRELERTPSISMLAASLPGVELRPFHIVEEGLEEADTAEKWQEQLGVCATDDPLFLALGDPFRLTMHGVVERMNEAYPGCPVVGGVASAGESAEENRLILNGEIHREGLVGLGLTGNLKVDTVVSQGCRPIGTHYVITSGNENIIFELGGRPALEKLKEVLDGLSEKDQELARQSLFVGRVINEYQDRFLRGDFLIQNILGADKDNGAMAIAGYAKVGTSVQFHVRDAASADEDLRLMLEPLAGRPIQGAVLFGCNGRGTHMWPQSGHDATVIRDILGDVPLAGFFCGGEFGPIGGRNFIHGFTASIALFQERDTGDAEPPA